MGRYVTVSVKIPREVKEKLEKLGIKPSELLRRVIVEELRRREVEDLERELRSVKDILDRISLDYIVGSIREDREGR
jgi:hypothetical protein